MLKVILNNKLLSLIGILIIAILLSGTLYKEREVEICLTLDNHNSQNLEVFLFNGDKTLIKTLILNSHNSESDLENDKTITRFWIDPIHTHSFYIKNITRGSPIYGVSLRNALAVSELNYRVNKSSNRLIVTLPTYLKDPLIYIDLLFSSLGILFLLLLYIKHLGVINHNVQQFCIANSKLILATVIFNILIVMIFILFGNRTYAPFKIIIEGDDLPSTQFSLQMDTGAGFNDIEKFYYPSSNRTSVDTNDTNGLKITNSTSINSDRNEVFIYSLNYNDKDVDLSDLENAPNIRRVFNNLYLIKGHSVILNEPFRSATIGFVNHPKSGSVNISVDGRILIEENLYSEKQKAGHLIHITNTNLLTVRKDNSIKELIINHPYWNTHIQNLSLSSPNFNFPDKIKKITLKTDSESSETKLLVENGQLRISPINHKFNSSISKFQIFCLMLLLTWISYATFLVQRLLNSTWFKSNFNPKSFLISLSIYLLIIGSLLAAVWPGALTADSFLMVGLERGNISNYKPLFYTIYLGIFTLFSNNPCYPIIFQTILFGLIFSFLVSICRMRGASYFWITLSTGTLITSPTIPLYMLTLWKDIPYSEGILILGLILYLLKALNSDSTSVNKIIFAVVLPLTILTAGFRHTGFLLPLTITTILYFYKYLKFKRSYVFLISAVLLGHLSLNLSSIILNTKSRTDYKRLELFPYLIYGSYIPWEKYLSNLSKKESVTIANNVSKIASINDLTGISVMFDNNKANLKASYPQIKAFKKEIIKAIIAEPQVFLGKLIDENIRLLNGKGYVWDEGFLPIKFNTKSDSDNYFVNAYRPERDSTNFLTGKRFLNYLKFNIIKKEDSSLNFSFSAWPPLLITILPLLFSLRRSSISVFCLFIGSNYIGIFLMPASIEFRYTFHLILSCVAIPMLIGLDLQAMKSLQSTPSHPQADQALSPHHEA